MMTGNWAPSRSSMRRRRMTVTAGPDQHKVRILLRLMRFAEAQASVPVKDVTVLLGVHAYELVNQSLENPTFQESRMDERLQSHLRNVIAVVARAYKVRGDLSSALHWFRRYQAS